MLAAFEGRLEALRTGLEAGPEGSAPLLSLRSAIVPDALASKVLAEQTQQNALSARAARGAEDADLRTPSEFAVALKAHFAHSCELLRHFWACYPITAPFLQARAEKITQAMSQLYDNVRALGGSVPGEQRARLCPMLMPITQSLDRALEHFEQQNRLREERERSKKARLAAGTPPAQAPSPSLPA
eukprot:tig00021493_g21906.t1